MIAVTATIENPQRRQRAERYQNSHREGDGWELFDGGTRPVEARERATVDVLRCLFAPARRFI